MFIENMKQSLNNHKFFYFMAKFLRFFITVFWSNIAFTHSQT